MTKAELIDRIARNRDLPPEVTKKIIAEILDLAFAELADYFVRSKAGRSSKARFSFPKFGTFTKKKRNGRRGVNPRTLEPIEIEACETIDFKPSAELKRQLNRQSSEAAVAPAGKSAKTRTKSKKTPARGGKRVRPAGPGGRPLVTREEVELETPALPEAPLQRVGRGVGRGVGRKRRSAAKTGS